MRYIVKKGDTLWGIAQRYLGSGSKWRQLGYTGDPRKLPVGYVLEIPGQETTNNNPSPQNQPLVQQPTTQPQQSYTPVTRPVVDPRLVYQPPSPEEIKQIAERLKSTYGINTSDLEQKANEIQQKANELAQSTLAQKGTINNIYDALAQRLEQIYQQEVQQQEQKTKANIGMAKEEAARYGFVPTEGFEAAKIRNISRAGSQEEQKILDKKAVELERLSQEKLKEIQNLDREAKQYEASGLSDAAKILLNLKNIKLAQNRLLSSAAIDLANARTSAEKDTIENNYRNQLLNLKKQEMALEKERADIDSSYKQRLLKLKEQELGGTTPSSATDKKAVALSNFRRLALLGIQKGLSDEDIIKAYLSDNKRFPYSSYISATDLLDELQTIKSGNY